MLPVSRRQPQRFARLLVETRRGKPAKVFRPLVFSTAAIVILSDNNRIEGCLYQKRPADYASFPAGRAGMASGADTCARMISLAFNIALMGFILVKGMMASLHEQFGVTAGEELRLLAEKVAAGDITVVEHSGALLAHLAAPYNAINMALIDGFGWVMVYGALSVSVLAVGSFFIFAPGSAAKPERCVSSQ